MFKKKCIEIFPENNISPSYSLCERNHGDDIEKEKCFNFSHSVLCPQSVRNENDDIEKEKWCTAYFVFPVAVAFQRSSAYYSDSDHTK